MTKLQNCRIKSLQDNICMGSNTAGCPAERLLAGERFSVDFAPVESELSRKVGDRLAYVTMQLIAA